MERCCRRCKIWGGKKRKNITTQTTRLKKWTFWRFMVAPLDLHIASWRSTLPCLTESSLPHSFIQPIHEMEVGFAARQDLRPYVSFVPTHPCFNCLYLCFLHSSSMKSVNSSCKRNFREPRDILHHLFFTKLVPFLQDTKKNSYQFPTECNE